MKGVGPYRRLVCESRDILFFLLRKDRQSWPRASIWASSLSVPIVMTAHLVETKTVIVDSIKHDLLVIIISL